MPRLEVTVNVNGNPLRRAYVEHLVWGFGAGMYITDNDGRVIDEDGARGIVSDTSTADIRIWCQNSVVRVLDGGLLNVAVSQDKNIQDGSNVNLNTNAEQDDYYAILNRCLLAYDIVFRQFRPYSVADDPDFPLGRKSTLRATKDRIRRIEVSYPSSTLVERQPYTEPNSTSTDYPLIHFLDRSEDGALLADGTLPISIPAEVAHGLHFARFPSSFRQRIREDYIGWMINEIDNGRSGRHGHVITTSRTVAFFEALDLFACNFAEYVRREVQGGTSSLLRPQEMTPDIRHAFLRFMADRGDLGVGGTVASLDSAGNIVPFSPDIRGEGCEGAIFGCIFIDFALRVGLLSAVNAYLRSTAFGALIFDDYRAWIAESRPQLLADLDAARITWGL